MAIEYGYKRLVTGAGYGLKDWIAQRLTATVLAVFTLAIIAQVLLISGPIDYVSWAGIFAKPWMKALSFASFLALAYHAWIGMRDIWMDYVQALAIRLTLHLLTLIWLLACAGWLVQVLIRL